MGVIFGVCPILVDLARTYKEMKGTDAHTLARNVEMIEAVYDQTCRCLLQSVVSGHELQRLLPAQGQGPTDESLWRSPVLQQKLLARLGPKKHRLALKVLGEMNMSLEHVKTELINICGGTVGTSGNYLYHGIKRIQKSDQTANLGAGRG